MSTKRKRYAFSILMTLCATSLIALHTNRGASADTPTTGFRADYLGQLDFVQKQIMALQQAVPQEKYKWRPAEDVRSISEVYAHIAYGNYIILSFAGIQPPADVPINMKDPMETVRKWDQATTDKASIAEMLRRSLEHARAAATKISDAELDKKVNMFGMQVTVRNVFITSLNHLHEHLGQSIAYARMNGVVPPWTAARQAREKQKSGS